MHTLFIQLVNEGYRVLPLHDAVYTNDEAVKRYAEQKIRKTLLEKYETKVSFNGEEKTKSSQ
ncbi:MAG: hypothetical protein EOO04_13095 [Chitinophagaceae bacterium]|nr:MAG: hypothetical protein EOO04_13095 [Chitinophagaceae bacterium]